MNLTNFVPQNEEQFDMYLQDFSRKIKTKISGLKKEHKVEILKRINPNDTILINLHLDAIRIEDYETCSATQILLDQRGIMVEL